MGAQFSSHQLSGAVDGGVPHVSYAYSASNTHKFGVDATYSDDADGWGTQFESVFGKITPYLIAPASAAQPTITCVPFFVNTVGQSLDCPITGASLATGLYTLSFSQYTTDSASLTQKTGVNTLYGPGGDVTFSIVPPINTVTDFPTVTSTPLSGISEVPATSTETVPSTSTTVTVYLTTIVTTQTSSSTLTGVSTVVTVTASNCGNTCPAAPASTTMLKCNADNCLRALRGKSVSASAFCSQYTKTCGMATPTYASQCSGSPSRVSSACSCLVTEQVKRGIVQVVYQNPDFTFNAGNTPVDTVTTAPTATSTIAPIPSTTM